MTSKQLQINGMPNVILSGDCRVVHWLVEKPLHHIRPTFWRPVVCIDLCFLAVWYVQFVTLL